MNRGTWWAAVYGVAQSQTRLKRLSSNSMQFIFSGKKVNGFQNDGALVNIQVGTFALITRYQRGLARAGCSPGPSAPSHTDSPKEARGAVNAKTHSPVTDGNS